MESFEISRAGIYSKYPEETLLFRIPVYTTKQRNFAPYVTAVIFTCKYYKFGLTTTGLSQSHFRNLPTCSIKTVILILLKFNDRDSNHPFLAIVSGLPFTFRRKVKECPPCLISLLKIIICRFLFASRAVFFLPSSVLIIYMSAQSSLNEPAVILGKVIHYIASTSHKVCVRSCSALDLFVVLRP